MQEVQQVQAVQPVRRLRVSSTTRTRPARRVLGAVLIAVVACASVAAAQDFRRYFGRRIAGEKTPYDGLFTFARLRHGIEAAANGREPPWAHDYPTAERNLVHILKEITLITPNLDKSNVVTQDDPDIFASPIVYVSEPGYWTMNDEELATLQEYVRKGGFLIFDDFRGEHYFNFQEQVGRLIPNARLVEIDPGHPVFHSFFDINIKETRGYYGPASFQGVFEDNDPEKRLLLVASYNHDLGELWEYSHTGFAPLDLTNDAYKYGVNYMIYAMTH